MLSELFLECVIYRGITLWIYRMTYVPYGGLVVCCAAAFFLAILLPNFKPLNDDLLREPYDIFASRVRIGLHYNYPRACCNQ